MTKNPDYLYTFIYTTKNSWRKRLLLQLYLWLFQWKRNAPVDDDTAQILRTYSKIVKQANKRDDSLKRWLSSLREREELAKSNLGSKFIELCKILEEANKQNTLMQIATFGFEVNPLGDGQIVIKAKNYQVQMPKQLDNAIRARLNILSQMSQTIQRYIETVVNNEATDELKKISLATQEIDLTEKPQFYEEIAISKVINNWQHIEQNEVERIPYIAGRPITEADLFFDREPELNQIRQSLKSNHVAIWGRRRIGKTSILHQLEGLLRFQPESEYRFIPIFVNVEPLREEKSSEILRKLIQWTHRFLIDEFALPTLILSYELRPTSEYTVADAEQDLHRMVMQLQQERGSDFQLRLVWLIDEIDKLLTTNLQLQAKLKALARSEVLSPYLALILVGLSHPRDFTEQDVKSFYASFESIHLQPLPPDAARKLVTNPVEGLFAYDSDAIDQIVQVCNYEPYLIQLLCREALGIALHDKRVTVTLQDVEIGVRYLPAPISTSAGGT